MEDTNVSVEKDLVSECGENVMFTDKYLSRVP